MNAAEARVVRSASFDPFRNLALEDCLFRKTPQGVRTLFLWINDPVVVIGRYQNPWIECRLDQMAREGVPFARRQSGGGAVYHDRGNLCATFMGPRSAFDRRANIALVLGALEELGVAALTNERNDVLVDGRKVSGSAYRETSERSFHHLTLLVDADLSRLSRYLQPTLAAGRAKGVASVRSPVANLASADGRLTVDSVSAALARRFAAGAEETDAETAAAGCEKEIEETMDRWKSWEWRFGSSPEFSLRLDGESGGEQLDLEIRGGAIAGASERPGGEDAAREVPELLGVRFDQAFSAALREIGKSRAEDGDASSALRYARWARKSERYVLL